ncbi:MAG: DUF1631 family protein [Caldimonas sp.]
MNPTEPRLHPALDAALTQIRSTAETVATGLGESLGVNTAESTRVVGRDAILAAHDELRRNLVVFRSAFHSALREKVVQEVGSRAEPRRKLETGSWKTLTLVDDIEVEERMTFERIGQMISHECEWQLRELAAYMGTVTGTGRADEDRNPLRADVVGAALYRGIEAATENPEVRKVLARELGQAMARAMGECYAEIIRGLQQRNVKPVDLTVRQAEGPGYQLPGFNSGYTNLPYERTSTRSAYALGEPSSPGGEMMHSMPASGPGSIAGPSGASRTGGVGRPQSGSHGAADPARSPYMSSGTAPFDGRGDARSGTTSAADAQLMTLLRRLTAVASHTGEFNPAPVSRLSPSGYGSMLGAAGGTQSGRGSDMEQLSGLMAVNLIRAHQEELMQASSGKLDHMVIEVVGSLFDQILSDARVPPQMARQIARLQLPVLRVALHDATFFSTRRHPVRRFINRIASLAIAFDDFDDGPGKQLLVQVAQLVQEIVEGDFDQIELYSAKLAELENFISVQAEGEAEKSGAASTLAAKESELRIQQRYMQQLRIALAPLQLPDYLADFLPQVWSQALVLAARHDGADSDRLKRFRRVGGDLVMSIQPKGSPLFRKRFLMQLPPLMKDLNEGMQLIGWPEAAQRELFAKLLPAHAESLKAPPMTELDYNMKAKQLESIFNAPIPGTDAMAASDELPEVEAAAIERRFTPEEAEQVGLVQESAVDWDGKVDIDLSADEPVESGTAVLTSDPDAPLAPTPSESGEPAEPSHGPQLIDHIQLGFAYQMHLKDQWQKVRLAHVSAGRSFFLFTRGAKHRETISMTSRMLARMCETGRMRAVESAYLMERATQRARKQLAVLKPATRH